MSVIILFLLYGSCHKVAKAINRNIVTMLGKEANPYVQSTNKLFMQPRYAGRGRRIQIPWLETMTLTWLGRTDNHRPLHGINENIFPLEKDYVLQIYIQTILTLKIYYTFRQKQEFLSILFNGINTTMTWTLCSFTHNMVHRNMCRTSCLVFLR